MITLSEMSFIKGGVYQMGDDNGHYGEKPKHEVNINPFLVDIRVVTNREYSEFIDDNPNWEKGKVPYELADNDYLNLWEGGFCPPEIIDFSVINVSYFAAKAFAKWAKKRLLTEAEWEYAAGGSHQLKWSLGNKFEHDKYVFGLDGGQPKGAKPCQFSPNIHGLFDMSGLVWEWVEDYYSVDFYSISPCDNPKNTNRTNEKCLRGGSAYFDNENYLRTTQRGKNLPNACHEDYGFRCAKDIN